MVDPAQSDFIGLRGKVALISGAGSGIGRATALAYGALGMKVAVIEIDPNLAASLRQELSAQGVDHQVETGDVTRRDDVERIVAATEARFGRLDVLVNNVGHHLKANGPFVNSTEEQWEALYAVNLKHMFLMSRAAIPLLARSGPGSSIINLSTIEAFRGIPRLAVYGAFKAGITGFTQSLAVELGPQGIRVNAIAPETTNSAQVGGTRMVPPENLGDLKRWFPIGRFGEPEDSAGAAVYLASERLSGWVTGSTILVDGGALAAGAWLQLPEGNRWTHLPIIDRDGYEPGPAKRK